MSIESRNKLIPVLEKTLNTRLVCYLTGDRMGMESQIGSDAVHRFYRHLESIGEVESISLFVYSRGGDTNVPWRLINLLREYCSNLKVLVPYKAHSAATMLCLGADEIVMGKMGELSSIDPSVANPFNPPDPMNPMARVPIGVEDVNAFRDLARRFGVDEKDSVQNAQVFMALAQKVDPLALGNVERSYNQIRKLAVDLLGLHIDGEAEGKEKIDRIVSILTERLYSHSHLINRREAQKIGLPITIAGSDLDALLWRLFSDFAEDMELEQPFNALKILGDRPTARIELKRAFIESRDLTDVFISGGAISRPMASQFPQGMNLPMNVQLQAAVQFDAEGWTRLR